MECTSAMVPFSCTGCGEEGVEECEGVEVVWGGGGVET